MNRLRRLLRGTGRIGSAVIFGVLMLAVSFGSAGIVAFWSHPPGTASRAELTWAGDQALGIELSRSQQALVEIAGKTERLAVLARGAIGTLTASDQGPFVAALTEGSALSRTIEDDAANLRAELTALPGGAPLDVLSYNGDVVTRRVGLIQALDATQGLARAWATLTSSSLQASQLIGLLAAHDSTVGAAAAQGRAADYAAALTTLDTALSRLDEAKVIRDRLTNTTDVSTLDVWIARNRDYDLVLKALYTTLRDANGEITDAVRAAYTAETQARANLPPDTRGLVLILADIGQGGLNQAAIAIDQARGRLDLAIQALN